MLLVSVGTVALAAGEGVDGFHGFGVERTADARHRLQAAARHHDGEHGPGDAHDQCHVREEATSV